MGVFEAERDDSPMSADAAASLVEADRSSCAPEQRALFRYELARAIGAGYGRVLLLRIARPVPVRGAVRGPAVRAFLRLAALGAWPYAVTTAIGANMTVRSHLYGALLSVVCTLMLAMAWAGWRYAERSAAPVGEMLCTSPDAEAFVSWLGRTQRLAPQLACSLAGLGLGVCSAYANFSRPGGTGTSALVSYLPAAWAGFLGGGVLYWIFVLARVPLRLRRAAHLRLSWLDPAHTPGIARLCTCYVLVSTGLGAGVVMIEAAGVAIATGRSPRLLDAFVFGFPVFAAALALYAGVQPFWTMSRIVRSYQQEAFGPLLTQVARPPHALLFDPALREALETYRSLRALRTLPVRTWAILQYVTGILASLIIFFLQEILK
ncbi:hypothetical protein [Actinomadura kijaniata]|uniref:hypothetical protein n=1 Tax=Actinomadura kijaniata TaxID=46161 RepID=UPI000833FA6D|nr:hypothetical protein [Actinomadura kijaniata]